MLLNRSLWLRWAKHWTGGVGLQLRWANDDWPTHAPMLLGRWKLTRHTDLLQ